jgi:hypothetical protein
MTIVGYALLVVGGIMLVTALGSIYATTMTARRSTLAPWALPLAGAAFLVGAIGGIIVR